MAEDPTTIRPGCSHMNCLPGSRDRFLISFFERQRISVAIPLCSFVSFVVKVLGFPITRDDGDSGDSCSLSFVFLRVLCGKSFGFFRSRAMTAISRDSGDSCGPLPASLSQDPTPLYVLLKTKAKPQFDRAVTERSKPIFCVFRWSNQLQFQPCFLVFAVRSAEGRNAAEWFG